MLRNLALKLPSANTIKSKLSSFSGILSFLDELGHCAATELLFKFRRNVMRNAVARADAGDQIHVDLTVATPFLFLVFYTHKITVVVAKENTNEPFIY